MAFARASSIRVQSYRDMKGSHLTCCIISSLNMSFCVPTRDKKPRRPSGKEWERIPYPNAGYQPLRVRG